MSPEDPLAAAEAALQGGDPDAAIRVLGPFLRAQPDAFRAHVLQARAFQAKGGPKQPGLALLAIRAFDEAERTVPPDRASHEELIALAIALDRTTGLREAYTERFGALPFAADTFRILRAADLAAPARRAAGDRSALRSPLVWGLASMVLIVGAGWWMMPDAPGSETAVGTAGAPAATWSAKPWEPGANLVVNGDAGGNGLGWDFSGPARVTGGEDSRFELAGDADNEAVAVQTIRLPAPAVRPGYLLLAARLQSSTGVLDGVTGVPQFGGRLFDAAGREVLPLSDPGLAATAPAGSWGVGSAAFALPPAAVTIRVRLAQGLKDGAVRAGVAAGFDDVAVYLFQSAALAREYAAQYDGRPPAGRFLEAAPAPAEAAAPGSTATSADRATNEAAAASFFDRLEPGMARADAAGILERSGNEPSWTRDFGLPNTTGCVALNVYFRADRIVRVALTLPYDERTIENRPGPVIREKGVAHADWEKGG